MKLVTRVHFCTWIALKLVACHNMDRRRCYKTCTILTASVNRSVPKKTKRTTAGKKQQTVCQRKMPPHQMHMRLDKKKMQSIESSAVFPTSAKSFCTAPMNDRIHKRAERREKAIQVLLLFKISKGYACRGFSMILYFIFV